MELQQLNHGHHTQSHHNDLNVYQHHMTSSDDKQKSKYETKTKKKKMSLQKIKKLIRKKNR